MAQRLNKMVTQPQPPNNIKRIIMTTTITAIYSSPRRNGNTARLTREAVRGARDHGAQVHEIVLRDLKISPCLEIYQCRQAGECAIQDDFQKVRNTMLASQGLIISSPIFFYTVSGHLKGLMDRFQSLWVKKYWIDQIPLEKASNIRQALIIAVGATRGRKLFDGMLLTMKYFLDVLDADIWRALLYRELDFADDILKHPEYLEEAYQSGQALVRKVAAPV